MEYGAPLDVVVVVVVVVVGVVFVVALNQKIANRSRSLICLKSSEIHAMTDVAVVVVVVVAENLKESPLLVYQRNLETLRSWLNFSSMKWLPHPQLLQQALLLRLRTLMLRLLLLQLLQEATMDETGSKMSWRARK